MSCVAVLLPSGFDQDIDEAGRFFLQLDDQLQWRTIRKCFPEYPRISHLKTTAIKPLQEGRLTEWRYTDFPYSARKQGPGLKIMGRIHKTKVYTRNSSIEVMNIFRPCEKIENTRAVASSDKPRCLLLE